VTSRLPVRIVVTGAESTGKTTLARQLADHFGALWVPEQARAYAERMQRPLTIEDVSAIGSAQIAAEDAAIADAIKHEHRMLVLDTDLISTVVYARHYYGTCPAWIEAEAVARRADLYLVCASDLPWTPDGIRDRPMHRQELDRAFREAMLEFKLSYDGVSGLGDDRFASALRAIPVRGFGGMAP
jgi:NadR type nicotinamide-nucleotide adenylyltransferase